MKSVFLGLNAKLALAVLVISGAMFTSCYESESGDVATPTTPPAPVYSIIGFATNVVDGTAVVIKSVTVSGFTTTLSGNSYSAVLESATYAGGAVTITAVCDGYSVDPMTINVTKLNSGSALYIANIVAKPATDAGFANLKITTASSEGNPQEASFSSAEYGNVDVVNNTNNYLPVTFSFKNVATGAVLQSDDSNIVVAKTRATEVDPNLKNYINNYLKAIYGDTPLAIGSEFDKTTKTYTFNVTPQSSLIGVSVTTKYRTDTITFVYEGYTYVIVLNFVYGYEYDNDQTLNAIYHGHGHGHGGDLNAGGGSGSGI